MSRGSIRFRSCSFLLFALAWCVLLVSSSVAQTTASGSTPEANQPTIQLKAESNLVLVRVVVRDGNGHPVEGLKKEDFRLFDQGKEQTISQFEEEPEGANGGRSNSPGAETPEAQGPGKLRFFALYFDNLNTSADQMIHARDAANAYLAEHLGPNDRVAVLTTDKVLTDFTNDPKKIHDALFQLQASARVKPHVRQCPDLTDYQALQILESNDPRSDAWMAAWAETKACQVSAVSSDSDSPYPDQRAMVAIQMIARKLVVQAHILAESNLDALRQLVNYLSRLPGERAVLVISPGFLSQSTQYQLDRVIDNALRSQVVVDTLDPKGLKFETREGDASGPSVVLPDPKAAQARQNLDAAGQFFGTDVLAEMTEGTGGEFIHDENDLTAGLEALAGNAGRYELAFVPKEMKRDGNFHVLKVTLAEKRKGYTLEARRGYYVPKEADEINNAKEETAATPPSTRRPAAEQQTKAQPAVSPEKSEIDDALKSQKDSDQLPIGIEVKTAAGQLYVLTHLDVRPLPLKKDEGRSQNQLTFVAAVFDQDNKAVEVKESHAKVDLSDDQLADFLSNGVEVQTVFQLKPGNYRLRIVVTEADENKVASLSRQVAVP